MVHMSLVEGVGLDDSRNLILLAICCIMPHILALETLNLTQVSWRTRSLAVVTVIPSIDISFPIVVDIPVPIVVVVAITSIMIVSISSMVSMALPTMMVMPISTMMVMSSIPIIG